jgi:aspartate/methionine/tyrosine aminotransferase
MIQVNQSGAKYSAIVGIGEKLKQLEQSTGQKYLRLNRGIPSVCTIDLSEIIPLIDFNSAELQNYPPNSGLNTLHQAINAHYFNHKTKVENIFITAGGMNALDLIFRTLKTTKVWLPEFFWGAYANVLTINKIEFAFYSTYDVLFQKEFSEGETVLIGDPNNPLGNKYDDQLLLQIVDKLDHRNVNIVWDSPYRKLFYENDYFYEKLLSYPHVIIADSFSKSLGLSGQRIGFVHSLDNAFNIEFNTNLLYVTNGVNAFGQILVEKLLTTPEGQKAAFEFRAKTRIDMIKNIEYLKNKGLLAEEFYQDSEPIGIFTVVNMSEEELLKHHIGSVGLYYFTKNSKALASKYSRLCISVPHQELKSYFDLM